MPLCPVCPVCLCTHLSSRAAATLTVLTLFRSIMCPHVAHLQACTRHHPMHAWLGYPTFEQLLPCTSLHSGTHPAYKYASCMHLAAMQARARPCPSRTYTCPPHTWMTSCTPPGATATLPSDETDTHACSHGLTLCPGPTLCRHVGNGQLAAPCATGYQPNINNNYCINTLTSECLRPTNHRLRSPG